MGSYIHNLTHFVVGLACFVFVIAGVAIVGCIGSDREKYGSWWWILGLFACVIGIIFVWPLAYTMGIFNA